MFNPKQIKKKYRVALLDAHRCSRYVSTRYPFLLDESHTPVVNNLFAVEAGAYNVCSIPGVPKRMDFDRPLARPLGFSFGCDSLDKRYITYAGDPKEALLKLVKYGAPDVDKHPTKELFDIIEDSVTYGFLHNIQEIRGVSRNPVVDRYAYYPVQTYTESLHLFLYRDRFGNRFLHVEGDLLEALNNDEDHNINVLWLLPYVMELAKMLEEEEKELLECTNEFV